MAPTISDSTDLRDFVVGKGYGVKGLAETGLQMVPKQYVQPLEERLDMGSVIEKDSIPIIDMSESDYSKVADSICDASEKWGFFQVINHGVPIQVLENAKVATRKFFELPAEEKNKHAKEYSPTNSVRYGTSFTPQAEQSLEWKDYLSLFYVSEEEAWASWPKECRDESLEFMKTSEPIIRRLLEALMGRLNVKELDERKECLLMGSKRINLNYYPKCPNPELTVGVGRHSDVSTLTVLLQDDVGGLYVRMGADDRWVHVPPIKGSLVINIGDALQILSNGRYKSVEHRVIANGTTNRVSVPIFVNPSPNIVIGPLSEVLEGGEKPLYKHLLYSDYVKHFFRKGHDGKKTVDFAII